MNEDMINGYRVISFNHINNVNRQHYYNVQCTNCNAIKTTTISNLRKSKGCKACSTSNFIGRKYGSLTIIRKIGITNHNTNVECRCDCGNITTTSTSNLTSGRHKSCGCGRRIKYIENEVNVI